MSEARRIIPKVTMVPATRNRFTSTPITSTEKRRVAAYARVSTDSDEQFTSYAAQVDYYTKYIQGRSEWEFVKVYTDEGITGTNTKKREGFNQMIADALDGKIDLIVTKSVSRFARNTVDSLTTIRKLKERGVEVFFEKENINTLDSKGELLLTIMSSLAQEESRSISENVTWGQRKRFADGKVSMPYKHFLGYRKGENGEPEILEDEAIIVRRIYRLFLEGKTPSGIAEILTKDHVPTPAGKSTWQPSTIQSILTNEKYKGDALLQKSFCVDFLTKKMKINEGEVPQYYVEDSHPAIVSAETFDLVQFEIEERKRLNRQHNGKYLLSDKIICGCCGSAFGRKVWHSSDPYRCIIWRCNAKYSNEKRCSTPHVTEEEVQRAFMTALNSLIEVKESVIADCRILMKRCEDVHSFSAEKAKSEAEMTVVEELLRKLIDENARNAIDQAEYNRQFDALNARYEQASARALEITDNIRRRQVVRDHYKWFISALKTLEPLSEFTESAWHALVDHVTVTEDKAFRFCLRNGEEVEVK